MTRHEHYHNHYEKGDQRPKHGGFIKRTIRGLAQRFKVSKGLVIGGFVILFLMSVPLAILTFLLAAYWIRNPGKLEDGFYTVMEKTRRAYDQCAADKAQSAPAGHPPGDDGLDFSELKEKFEDLEKRAGKMEEHVSSDEYTINRELDDIRKD